MHRVRLVRWMASRPSLHLAAALGLFLLPASAFAQEQDVAEAARQETARKAVAEKHKGTDHVYTNEDLKRSQILTPEDHAQVEARKRNQPAPPATQPADSLDAANPKSPESLGEVARRYRRDKAARQAQEALKRTPNISLPSDLSQPVLASPRPSRVVPVTPFAPSLTIAPPSSSRILCKRRDPFSRPPVTVLPEQPRGIMSHATSPSISVPSSASSLAPRAKPFTPAVTPRVAHPKTTAPPAISSRVTIQA